MTNTQTNSHADLGLSTSSTPIKQLQIVVRWGQSVLAVRHLYPLRSFYVGETSSQERCDHVIPAALLGGASRHELVSVDETGQVQVNMPLGSSASVTIGDSPCVALGGPQSETRSVALLHGHELHVELGQFSFEISSIAEPKLRGRSQRNKRSAAATVLSALMHIGILAATAAFVPQMSTTDDMMPSDQDRYTMQQYLDSAAEREREATEQAPQNASADASSNNETNPAEASETASHTPTATARRPGSGSANPGARGGGDYPITAQEAVDEAGGFGIVGLLRAQTFGNVPSWTPMADNGGFPSSQMWDGDLFSPGGLDMSSPGFGSDADPSWYRLPSVTTPFPEFAPRGPLLTQTRKPTGPNLRVREPVDVSKGIPAAVIQRIIRANFGRFRACYNAGLRTNPSLSGRVAVRFLISRTGTVSSAADGGSSMPDKGVVSCVVGAFRGLTFPAPESGVVTVSYPIMFMPPATT